VKQIYHTFHGHIFHSYFGSFKTKIFKEIERNLAKKTTKIIAISDIQKRELSKIHRICPEEKIEVVPLGFDLERFSTDKDFKRKEFRKKWNIKENEIAIGIIGRLVPIKNHFFFIDVIQEVQKKSKVPIKAFIVGDGEEKQNIINYIKSKNLDYSFDYSPATFHLTSWIKEIDRVNSGMDIICLTSLNEGTPVSLIEAQASGKPIVSTKTGGIENIVIENKTALLSKNNDLHTFSKNLLSLVNDSEKRKLLSEYGLEKSKDFHYDKLINNIKKLYS